MSNQDTLNVAGDLYEVQIRPAVIVATESYAGLDDHGKTVVRAMLMALLGFQGFQAWEARMWAKARLR